MAQELPNLDTKKLGEGDGVPKLDACIVTVGDELLIGQVTDTNAAYLAAELTQIGVAVSYAFTIGDDLEAIRTAMDDGMRNCSITLVTGGLGPTPDDRTREAAAAWIGLPLKTDHEVLTAVERRFASLGRSVPPGAERVAEVPDGFEILSNHRGTAPGLWYRGNNGNILVLLPGVPHEMKSIFTNYVVPQIQKIKGCAEIAQHTIKVAGIGETVLQNKIETFSHVLDPDLTIAYLPGYYGVRIRLTIRGSNAVQRLDAVEKHFQNELGTAIFGQDRDTLESVLGHLLKTKGMTIAVAESCTGGLVLHQLTSVSGASEYVLGGVVAYSNQCKQDQLDVDRSLLEQFGAVSESVAIQMAQGVRKHLGSNIGVSVTGIAGPSGGTKEKPVGLVWIGYADGQDAWAVRHQFGHGRHQNIHKSACATLNLVRKSLLKRSNSGT